ncbi:hypothetical protein PIIN_00816 [Serendipita indica DSM 11827]|uniref:Transmembrane protein n=1 Tax=Serendipita indica (strain DSM 11827) TaxID=1109443 RepID=G4T6N5_SERID|nr:hypothetical protein PIIN_00816 [Serendipita indica DSM 11827]
MSLWRLVAHVLGLLALAVSGTHGSSGWLAMAVNRDGFVHYDDKWTNSTYYVEANSTGAELLFAYNGYSVDVVTLYHHAVHPTFDIYLDGRAIEPNNMTVTSSLNSSDPREAETNGIISVGDAPGDHQLLLRTTSSVVVFLTGFEIHFNSSSARSSTFGLYAGNIPQEASYVDNTGDVVAYSPEGWDLGAHKTLANNKTLSLTSTPGAWVEVLVDARGDPSTWLYGMISQESSWAKAQLFRVDDYDRIPSKEDIIRVGGDESHKPLDSPIHQVPLYSTGKLESTKAYIIRLTLLNGTLSFDFARSQSQFFSPKWFLQRPPKGISLSLETILIATILPIIFIALFAILGCIGWRRYRQSRERIRVGKRRSRPQFVGKTTVAGKELSLMIPIPFDSDILAPTRSYTPTGATTPAGVSATSTNTIPGSRFFQNHNPKLRLRGEVLDNNEGAGSVVALMLTNTGNRTAVHGVSDASSYEFESESGIPAEENENSGLDGSLLFSATTSYIPSTSEVESFMEPASVPSAQITDNNGGGKPL